MTKHGLTDWERFFPKFEVNPETECWDWAAATQSNGYGYFGIGKKADGKMGMILAHRFSYLHHKGEIPEGTEIDHLCRNRRCVNPNHLEAVTRQMNQLRGFSVSGEAARRTHCPQGHEYDEQNTVYTKEGHRKCRICQRNHARNGSAKYRQKMKNLI